VVFGRNPLDQLPERFLHPLQLVRVRRVGQCLDDLETEPPPTPGLRREGSRGVEKGISCGQFYQGGAASLLNFCLF
jgi:hypothetical protein